jgi:TatD DNase family protein
MDLIDTHCHLDFNRFDDDRDEVVQRAANAGVSRIIVPGLDEKSSRAAVALADHYPGVYAAVGFHPNSVGPHPRNLQKAMGIIRGFVAHDKVIALGEIGLDYYWDKTPRDIQETWLIAQLRLAAELELPVILHNRESTADILALLQDWVGLGLPQSLITRPGVMHSFSAGWDDSQKALSMGFYLGFTGPITFKNADDTRQIAARVPFDRILVETDSPFLTPHPYRGKRNEPAYVQFVAERLAEVRQVPFAEAARQTTYNADRLFDLSTQQVK